MILSTTKHHKPISTWKWCIIGLATILGYRVARDVLYLSLDMGDIDPNGSSSSYGGRDIFNGEEKNNILLRRMQSSDFVVVLL